MRLPRMTIQRWMIVVAVSALVMGGIAAKIRLDNLQVLYRAQSQKHAILERQYRRQVPISSGEAESLRYSAPMEEWPIGANGYRTPEARKRRAARLLALADVADREAVQYEILASYHSRMKAKYERAAEQPWGHVAPDPPIPSIPADREHADFTHREVIYATK